jgi:hypothetical protein
VTWTNQLHAWKSIGLQGNIQSFDANTGLGWYNFTDANIPNVYSLLGRSVRFVFFVFCFCSSALTRGHLRWLSTPTSITALAPAAIKLVLVSCVVHVSCVVWCVVWCRVVSCGVVSCRVVSCRVVSCRVVPCRAVSCREPITIILIIGTAGKRLLIGVIGVANTATLPPAQVPITVDNKYENLPCVTSPSPAPKPPSTLTTLHAHARPHTHTHDRTTAHAHELNR